jgi:foldase protein PrsA
MVDMAVRRTRKAVAEKVEETPTERKKIPAVAVGIAAAVLVLALFWYKTDSWPIVALVGWRPVTRFEAEQELFKQGGKAVVDDIVTQILIGNELKKNHITVTNSEIDAKIEEVKKTLGENSKLEDVLAANGTTLTQFRKQLGLRIGIEKILENRIAVTDEELTSYMVQNQSFLGAATDEAKRNEAKDMLKISKLQTEANKWITELKAKTRIWTLPGL